MTIFVLVSQIQRTSVRWEKSKAISSGILLCSRRRIKPPFGGKSGFSNYDEDGRIKSAYAFKLRGGLQVLKLLVVNQQEIRE